MAIDWDKVKFEIGYIAHGDHMGDVNNGLPALCKALGLAPPRWDDAYERFTFEWEDEEMRQDAAKYGAEEYEGHYYADLSDET